MSNPRRPYIRSRAVCSSRPDALALSCTMPANQEHQAQFPCREFGQIQVELRVRREGDDFSWQLSCPFSLTHDLAS